MCQSHGWSVWTLQWSMSCCLQNITADDDDGNQIYIMSMKATWRMMTKRNEIDHVLNMGTII